MSKIVVRITPGHPTGIRRRAWFKFTTNPVSIEVDKNQLKEIKQDKYLKILTKWTAFEQWVVNFKKKEEAIIDTKKDEWNEVVKIIIEKLLEKWLIEGVDFNKDAEEKDLMLLLNN